MKTFKLSLILLLMVGAFSCKKDGSSSTSTRYILTRQQILQQAH